MVSSDLEDVVGDSLRGICAEVFARKGYHVTESPDNYEGVDILAVSPVGSKEEVFFVTIAGRSSVKYLGKNDMEEAIPKDIDMPVGGILLIVTTARRSSSGAREVARADDKKKRVWYATDLLNELDWLDSEYLIELYSEGFSSFDTQKELESRFDYQDIEVGSGVIGYICNQTYHPRRLIAFVELRSRGYDTELVKTDAVQKFTKETDVLRYLD